MTKTSCDGLYAGPDQTCRPLLLRRGRGGCRVPARARGSTALPRPTPRIWLAPRAHAPRGACLGGGLHDDLPFVPAGTARLSVDVHIVLSCRTPLSSSGARPRQADSEKKKKKKEGYTMDTCGTTPRKLPWTCCRALGGVGGWVWVSEERSDLPQL